MNNIINKLAGGEKVATPTRRCVVIATMITAALLVIALITLAVSSVIFAVADARPKDTEPVDDPSDGGDGVDQSVTLEYTAISTDEMDDKLDALTSGKSLSDRTIEGNNIYYAYVNPSNIKLSSGALNKSHEMLVDFAKNTRGLKTDKNASDCNVPIIDNVTNNGASFKILVFSDNSTTYKVQTYNWLYTNAYKYGFVYAEDTFTYVGVVAAKYAKDNGNRSLDTLSSPVSLNVSGATYQVYYISADAEECKVPTSYKYSVFSVNGGYVVTVNMSLKISAQ